jgi:hypothetical protein
MPMIKAIVDIHRDGTYYSLTQGSFHYCSSRRSHSPSRDTPYAAFARRTISSSIHVSRLFHDTKSLRTYTLFTLTHVKSV